MKKKKSIQEIRKEAKEIAKEIIQLRRRPDFNKVMNEAFKSLS